MHFPDGAVTLRPPDVEGNGVATRAACLAVDHALGSLGFHWVEILASVTNLRSQRVAQRLGATLEARLTERLWWATC